MHNFTWTSTIIVTKANIFLYWPISVNVRYMKSNQTNVEKTLDFHVILNLQNPGIGDDIAIFWTMNDPPGLQGLRYFN